uniref:Contactin-2 n=1 Tax=Denticeps clupeoides TaxID=299321 RepID=A0AAY4DC77_9TELE
MNNGGNLSAWADLSRPQSPGHQNLSILVMYLHVLLLTFMFPHSEKNTQHGPVFTQEPSDSIFPLSSDDNKVFINCKAKGNPPPNYRWKFNGREVGINADASYSLVEGNLLISNPQATQHDGVYQCIAANPFGTVVSREARVEFAYLRSFSSKPRSAVSVREGQAVVLLCGPPPHSGGTTYSWIFNGRPGFLVRDNRRFVSQRTGNLYIAKVEPSDVGNYTCVVSSKLLFILPLPSTLAAVMGEYEPKIEVQFPETVHVAKGSSVKLECFALGNPVPSISWRRTDGSPFPGKIKINQSNGVLEIPYFRPEDAGLYECVAENSRGKNIARGRLLFNSMPNKHYAYMAIDSNLQWECRAHGKPKPSYKWLKNGEPFVPGDRVRVDEGRLAISNITLLDSGMYQCAALNQHGVIYASAELKVVASPPDFSKSPVKKSTLIQRGGEAVIECRPHASPRASYSWRKGGDFLKNTKRRTILEDGTLRITNVSKSDGGRYTCIARNPFGTASSTGTLVVKEPTKITVPPLSMDATVGESIVLPCEVFRDATLEPTFKWFFNGKLIDFSRQEHFEMIAGDLMIRNVQLKHLGKYVCMVHTLVDSVSAAADLVVRGSPCAPEGIVVGELTSTSAQISWLPGSDNHSPISSYIIQARTPFSIGWQAVKTVPDYVPGQMLHATAVELNPWVDYEFRVVAINGVGVGEPSMPFQQMRTRAAAPEVAPSSVNGGGGNRGELVIVWEPVPEELQNGAGFGYIVAFRRTGTATWKKAVVASAEASKYTFKNESVPPLSLFEAKIGVYNNVGEGPFSDVVTVYSAEEEPSSAPSKVWAHALSASEIQLYWEPVPWKDSSGKILGYEVREEGEAAEDESGRLRVTDTVVTISGLKGSTPYLVSVSACNSAGNGPFSTPVNVTTKKPPPSQPPGNIEWNLTNSKIFLNWEHVKAMDNESDVTGYKVRLPTECQYWRTVTFKPGLKVEGILTVTSGFLIVLRVPIHFQQHSSGPIRIPKMSSRSSILSIDKVLVIYLKPVEYITNEVLILTPWIG